MRSFFVNLAQCLLGKIILKSFNFITLPLLTFYITKEEMGIYQLLIGGMGIFAEVVTLGTRQYYGVEFFKHRTPVSRLQLISNNLWVYFRISSLFYFLLVFVMIRNIGQSYTVVCFIVIFQSYINLFNELYLNTLQYQMRFFRFNAISLCFGVFQVSAVVFVIVVLHQHLLGLVIALLTVELLQFSYTLFCTADVWKVLSQINKKKKKYSQQILKNLKKSIIFVPSTVSFWLLMNIDQWMLDYMLGLESVGLYAFASKFPLLFDYLLASSFSLVYTPLLYKKFKSHFENAARNNILVVFLVLSLSSATYFIAGKTVYLLQPIVSENYHAALTFIPPLIFVACLRFATDLLQHTLRYKHHITFIIATNIFVALMNCFLNYFWIPIYGIEGCVFATVTSFLLLLFINLCGQIIILRKHTEPEVASITT